jgi:hypothetical protein
MAKYAETPTQIISYSLTLYLGQRTMHKMD